MSVILGVPGAALTLDNLGALHHVGQEMIPALLAYAPGHMAVFCYRVFQPVTHHGVFVAIRPVGVGQEILVDGLKAVGAIVVVGVDHGEGTVHQMPGGQCRLGGAPGLGSVRRAGVAGRQIGLILEDIVNRHGFGNPISHTGAECPFNFRLDHENYRLEPCPVGIEHRVIQNQLIVCAYRV